MKQTIVVDIPPVYDRCCSVFGRAQIEGRPILWAWGDVIYNPMDIDIPRELLAHEGVHGVRQLATGVEKWWDNYLVNPEYRFREEVAAHQAEWQAYRKYRPGKNNAPMLEIIAGKLASPLYGNMVDLDTARTNVLLRA